MPLPVSLVSAFVSANSVICGQHYEAVATELGAIKSTVPPPLYDLLEATAACLRPLPPDGNPDIIRRAQYRVAIAQMVRYRLEFGDDDIVTFVRSLFAKNDVFATLECEMS